MVMIIESRPPRPLSAHDFQHMRLPTKFVAARMSEIREPLKTPIKNFLNNRHGLLSKGVGLTVYGGERTGKSSACALVIKSLRSLSYSTLFAQSRNLADEVWTNAMFDENTSLLQRCKDVDVLCLDGISEGVLADKRFGLEKFLNMIIYRQEELRVTLVTIGSEMLSVIDGSDKYPHVKALSNHLSDFNHELDSGLDQWETDTTSTRDLIFGSDE